MPFDDIEQQTGAMSDLASMPQAEAGAQAAPTQGQGGPGVDTPQEQQAVKLLIEGMKLIRQASTVDTSIRPIVDKVLPDAFLQFSQHYGYGEEGKLALKQAQMLQSKARAASLAGGPPGGSAPMTGPPSSPKNMAIEY